MAHNDDVTSADLEQPRGLESDVENTLGEADQVAGGTPAPQGMEMLAQGSSYVIITGAATEEETQSLRKVIPIALVESYEDLYADA